MLHAVRVLYGICWYTGLSAARLLGARVCRLQGRGLPWRRLEELYDRFHLEAVPCPSGVTHHLFGGNGMALLPHLDDDLALGPSVFNEIQSVLGLVEGKRPVHDRANDSLVDEGGDLARLFAVRLMNKNENVTLSRLAFRLAPKLKTRIIDLTYQGRRFRPRRPDRVVRIWR